MNRFVLEYGGGDVGDGLWAVEVQFLFSMNARESNESKKHILLQNMEVTSRIDTV